MLLQLISTCPGTPSASAALFVFSHHKVFFCLCGSLLEVIVLFLSGVNSVMEAFFFFSRDVLLGFFSLYILKWGFLYGLLKAVAFMVRLIIRYAAPNEMLFSLVSVKPRTDSCVDKSQSAQKANGVQRYSISLRPHFFLFPPDLMVGLWLWRQRLETHKRMIDCRRFVLFFPLWLEAFS